ncbi:hypothetical protein ACH0CG_09330 [Microbacterium sp. 179-I 1D1 NHS]|uniref:alpha-L-rhamnosidase-related protein n=1 Tax=Microbacterium sp. 179-I 1D1 NHS TaxID=3374298 RepID=UPI003879E4EE
MTEPTGTPQAASTSVTRPRRDRLREDLLEIARNSGPDRLPDLPTADYDALWLYADGDFEAATLRRIVSDGHGANRFVDYVENFETVGSEARFRAVVPVGLSALQVYAPGRATVRVDAVTRAYESTGPIELTDLTAGGCVDVRVRPDAGEPPVMRVDGGSAALRWKSARADGGWSRVVARTGGVEPPHRRGEPEVMVPLQPVGGDVFAAPAPVVGRIVVRADRMPGLTTGESLEEALADSSVGESRLDLDEEEPGVFVSRHQLGFRFARLSGVRAADVWVRAAVRPAPRRGAFASGDATLNTIWSTGQYTLRLCMQSMLIDGIKRDRMPWVGDHALGVLTNAYGFGDAGVARDTLTAMGRIRHGYINGIADYSLWWVISQGLYQRQFGDREHLERASTHFHDFLSGLAEHSGADGVFRPAALPDAFAHAGPGSVFLDWGVTLTAGRDATAVQMLWCWALRSGAELLRTAGHAGADAWSAHADRAEATIRARGWSETDGCWREYLDQDTEPTAYPNFLATLAGIDPPRHPETIDRVGDVVRNTSTGTPFMRSMSLLASGMLGQRRAAVGDVRRLWGRMVDVGAMTFWEDFADDGASPYEMYGRPFGKSLCHAWAAGPVALLPRLILGVTPSADGWREFTVDPDVADVGWAGAVIPAPTGDIIVFADERELKVIVPEGSTLVQEGERHVGPTTVTRRVPSAVT